VLLLRGTLLLLFGLSLFFLLLVLLGIGRSSGSDQTE
jgi:hypothetical protein